nr:very-long-chain (3R)-3-hydroxyacyl-CoA dehydratase PASTICCINO 2 [Ipomoea batatas]
MAGGVFSGLRRFYLALYNWVVFVVQVFYLAVKTLMESGHENVYQAVEKPLLLAQSAAVLEIIRYSFFGTKEAFGRGPSGLLWLRYSSFILLYPTGITSEVGLIYKALPYLKQLESYYLDSFTAVMFKVSDFVLSIAGSPHMYGYMLGQRKKALRKAKQA